MIEIDAAEAHALLALAIGFAFAGFLSALFKAVTSQSASFRLLQIGGLGAVAAVPLVVFAAPFIILRNTVRGRTLENRNFGFVVLATIIASFWSLVAGRVLLDYVFLL